MHLCTPECITGENMTSGSYNTFTTVALSDTHLHFLSFSLPLFCSWTHEAYSLACSKPDSVSSGDKSTQTFIWTKSKWEDQITLHLKITSIWVKIVKSNEWIRIMRWSRVNVHLSLSWLGPRSLCDAFLIEGPLTASSGLLKFIPIYIGWHHAYPATLNILLSRLGLLHEKKSFNQLHNFSTTFFGGGWVYVFI